MGGFISLMTEVLGISLTVGTVTLTLGAVALGTIVIGSGVRFFKSLKGGR